MEPLPPDARRIAISARPPLRMAAGERLHLPVVLENRTGTTLRPDGEHAVMVASRWLDPASGETIFWGPGSPLVRSVGSGGTQRAAVTVIAPPSQGEAVLDVCAYQGGTGWFSDDHPEDAVRSPIRIGGEDTLLLAADRELPGLRAMVDEVAAAPELLRPSAFWQGLASEHLAALVEQGFAEFKRTVNLNYFQFAVVRPGDPHIRRVARAWLRRPVPSVFAARLTDEVAIHWPGVPGFDRRSERRTYASYVAALWECARRSDPLELVSRLEEPALGHPVAVHHRGRRISQDLANSVLELSHAWEGAAPPARPTVVELGAGYGRIAWALLAGCSGTRYVIVDVPPALAVSQRYLSELFPDRRIRRFGRLEDPVAAAEEVAGAELAFLTPNQFDAMPSLEADLFVSVSALHEMRPEQVGHLLGLADRHCRGRAYTKQWLSWHNPDDDVLMRREDYPWPSAWRHVYERADALRPGFFEACFTTGAPEASGPRSAPPTNERGRVGPRSPRAGSTEG